MQLYQISCKFNFDFIVLFCTCDIYCMSVHPGRGIPPLRLFLGSLHLFSPLLKGFSFSTWQVFAHSTWGSKDRVWRSLQIAWFDMIWFKNRRGWKKLDKHWKGGRADERDAVQVWTGRLRQNSSNRAEQTTQIQDRRGENKTKLVVHSTRKSPWVS